MGNIGVVIIGSAFVESIFNKQPIKEDILFAYFIGFVTIVMVIFELSESRRTP